MGIRVLSARGSVDIRLRTMPEALPDSQKPMMIVPIPARTFTLELSAIANKEPEPSTRKQHHSPR